MCDSQSATYSIANYSCTSTWNVVGGTIVSGTDTSIVVDWNAVDGHGFGYVEVVEPCAACPDTTTIKIPVILASGYSRPAVICENQEYQYSLP